MSTAFQRTERLLGPDAMQKLNRSRVAVFGLGGVGGYVVEALARSGVGALDLIDRDTVSESNINRQILALHSTVGKNKVDVAKDRVLDINPECTIKTYMLFYTPDTADQFDFSEYDYVVDCVDTVTAKKELILRAKEANTPIISSMGTGNKLDPTAFRVADLYDTSVDPLARILRKELRKLGVDSLKVVYSTEEPLPVDAASDDEEPDPGRRSIPGSNAFVPSVAGLTIAGEVIKDLVK